MNSLTINRFKFRIIRDTPNLVLSATDRIFFAKEGDFILKRLANILPLEMVNTLQQELSLVSEEEERKIYFGFGNAVGNNCHIISEGVLNFPFLKRAYLKTTLIEIFQRMGYLVEPFPTGVDIAIYKKTSDYTSNWATYSKFDIRIFPFDNELSISAGSNDTLISATKFDIINEDQHIKIIDSKDGLIKRVKFNSGNNTCLIVANAKKRKELNIKNKPQKIFYQSQYKEINSIYSLLLTIEEGDIRFESGGFKTVHPADISVVDFDKNQMLFGKGLTDVNAASGMRDGGPFEIPKQKAETVKFLFIYQNREQANNLFIYLKRGLKHFPGLLSYVGVSVNVSNERLQYTDEKSLPKELNEFVSNVLVNESYMDYFALVLLPFSKESADTVENELYFEIKEKLLKKGIGSQLIDSLKINSANFHYHLPNISIAILAKIGGIPWKLLRKPYNELIIGFNEETFNENKILGTAVYFDNSGRLRQIKSFNRDSRDALIIALKDSIENYLQVNENDPPERMVIHYYKPPKRQDVSRIDNLIRNEFRFNLPFALVEVNDAKGSTDICFDVEFNYGMPISGTHVKLHKDGNEYLLFNNQRYWKNPLKPITSEEYPVKVKLYNTETGGFNHKELLSQVYEFSRLYWKGLKQRSQPVTTQYSKMIAEFAAHFENGDIPNNEVSQKTAWFI